MKIAINLIPFSSVQGIEIYSQNIIKCFLKLSNDDFFIFTSNDLPKILNFNKLNTIRVNLKQKYKKALWQQFNIYSFIKKYKIDLLLSPSPSAPFFCKNKIVIIHDCAYDRFQEFDNFLSKFYFRIMYYGAKYFSKKIITPSIFSKNELINFYGINPDKIEVIYEAVPELPVVGENFFIEKLEKFKINKLYFLYIGNTRPRKNIVGLIKAFKLFLNKSGQDYLLVIAGRIEKRFLNLEKEIKKAELEDRVILTDFVTQEEKTLLYKKSTALCFPSFYEGFGLPILEAQSLGVPVLTSNTASMPEVAGKGALYVNPYDINDIAEGMVKLIENNDLRHELIRKGFENIKRFSWEESVRKILKIFYENSSN